MAALFPRTLRTLFTHRLRREHRQLRDISTSSLPKILQPSLWRTVTPRSLRPSSSAPPEGHDAHTSLSSLVRNPAAHVTLLAILCGSQAIHVLSLKTASQDADTRLRKKIALLNEVISKIRNGEAVDVRKELGTGDEQAEKEWEEVLERLGNAETWLKNGRKAARKENQEKTTEFSWNSLGKWFGTDKESTTPKPQPVVEQEDTTRKPAFF